MRVFISAFESEPNAPTEAGLAWSWAKAYCSRGYEVHVLCGTPQSESQLAQWQSQGIVLTVLGNSLDANQNTAPQKPIDFLMRYRRYKAWSSAVTRFLEFNASASKKDFVHHVSWGSVRLMPPRPPLGVKLIWGPLGGAQLPTFNGLTIRSYAHEFIRLATFPVALVAGASFVLIRRGDIYALATNSATFAFLKLIGCPKVNYMLADGVADEDVSYRSRTMNGKQLSLVWAGRFIPTKRPDLAIKISNELNARGVPTRLTLFGSGKELPRLISLAARTSPAESLVFHERIPWLAMKNKLRDFDYLVFTSMRDSSCPAVLEAASKGVPSIGFSSSGYKKFFEANATVTIGKYVEHNFVSQIVNKVIQQGLEREAYKVKSKACIELAVAYSWTKKIAQIESLLNE